mgnify:CR=1 FL=1
MNLNNILNNKVILVFIILIWPYIFLFPLTFEIIVMGNDFDLIYFSYKRYIAEMLSEGVIPLWSPTNGTGSSLIFNPFAQYFYVPGWFNYLIHFITKNLTLHNFLIYTIFSISIFSLGIFKWLKSLKIDHIISLLACLMAACSLKVTELLRLPNAANAAAWMPWILYGINLILNGSTKKGFLIIFFSNLFILTSGYPYFIVYSLFLFVPYIIFLPIILNSYFFCKNNLKILYKFYTLVFLSFSLSYLIALPWLFNVKNFLNNLVDRTEKNWEFATEHTFFWKDTLGSWFFPPSSSTEGWYYSGIIVTIIIFYGIISNLVNLSNSNSEKKLFNYSILFILFITYLSWGKNSILFEWAWYNIPLFGSLRTWPRINIILVPFIILIFSISVKNIFIDIAKNEKKDQIRSIAILVIVFLVLIVLQSVFYISEYHNEEYWQFWQKKRFDAAINFLPSILGNILQLYNGPIYIIFNIISFVFLFFIFKYSFLKTKKISISFIILLIISLELFVLSNLQWSLNSWKTNILKEVSPLKKLQSAFVSRNKIDTVKGNEYFRDSRAFNVNYPDNYGYSGHAKNYTQYFERYEGKKKKNILDKDLELVYFFYGASLHAKKIFLSKSVNHNNIVSFVKDSQKFESTSNFKKKILIERYDGNTIELEIFSNNDGWLSVIDNWDKGWIAYINGRETKIHQLLDSYKSIKVKKGFSKVKFQYKPWYKIYE